MPFKKDNNKPIKTNNRFASLASDKDGENGFKKVTGRSGRSRGRGRRGGGGRGGRGRLG